MSDTINSSSRITSGAVAIVVTVAGLSILGAVGLWEGVSTPLSIVGIPWSAISTAVWLVYGGLLLAFFRKPARRAELRRLSVVLALAWGGLAVTNIAARANGAASQIAVNVSPTLDSTWSNVFVAPVIEETLKMLGIILLVLLPAARRIGSTAGMVVGALIGASFQVIENEVFTLQEILKTPETPGTVLVEMLLVRGLVGVFSHVVYSGAIGAAIGWFLTGPTSGRARRLLATIGVFILMVVLHSWSNWTAHEGQGIMYVLTMGVGLLVLILTLRFARSHSPATAAIPEA
jgi:RsiW-degrading membrane proteinase PrsW (M82 family)